MPLLPLSIGLEKDQMLVLDTFRVKRNAADYTGEDIDEVSVAACTDAASALLGHVQKWLMKNRPDLFS